MAKPFFSGPTRIVMKDSGFLVWYQRSAQTRRWSNRLEQATSCSCSRVSFLVSHDELDVVSLFLSQGEFHKEVLSTH
jgi:hypothetical protein